MKCSEKVGSKQEDIKLTGDAASVTGILSKPAPIPDEQ